ncbi:putative ribonuclease H-like domain-containing protein [Tanacetum coccineum]
MTKSVTEHAEPKKTLVDLPYGKRAIGTKWVYRNKKDERGIVIRNKARLVAQCYTQEEGINYDEVFALVAMIEAIRLFLDYASFKDFVVYQMDVKSAFLYGKIEEEVYVCQPPGFEDPKFPDRVYKVEKVLYGLHQALKAWYETLSTYLLDNGFQRGTIDKTLFIKKVKGDILLVQVYVDDIIFGSTKKSLCTDFEKLMHKKFQTSFMGELTFFLGLQVTHKNDGIFISQDKYMDEILKKLMIGSLMYLTSSRPDIMFVDSPFDLEAYTDSDYAGASLDRKFTTGGCQFIGSRLISWQCKKQTVVANSTTEVEYVAASNCCVEVLWIQNQLLDYGYNFMNTKIFIDNESTICIVKNLVFHLKTKHIEIRHHFIRDSYEKRLIQVNKIHTDHNVADLLTKAFDMRDIHEERGYSMERAATTAAGLDAKQDSEVQNKKKKARTSQLKRMLIKVRIESSANKSLGDQEDASKQGMNIAESDQDEGISFVQEDAETQGSTRSTKQFILNDPPLLRVNTLGSGEDIVKLNELMEICTKLSDRVLALENIKTAQDLEIINLKKRVKKLEKKKKARTPQLKRRLFKGRNIAESDQDEEISFVQEDAETQGRYDHDIDVTTASTPITTVGVSISTVEPSTPPITKILIEDEDLTIAQTLMKNEK